MTIKTNYIDFLYSKVKVNGIAAIETEDGSAVLFSREWAKKLMDSDPDQNNFLVIIKNYDHDALIKN